MNVRIRQRHLKRNIFVNEIKCDKHQQLEKMSPAGGLTFRL